MEKEDQTKIDDLYTKIWAIIDDLETLKRQALEVGEILKEFVSKEVFK